MPIRPDLRHFYSGQAWQDWRAIILRRAGDCCERCGVPNHETIARGAIGIWRDHSGRWWTAHGGPLLVEPQSGLRQVRIVLTIAHLNHVPGDDREDNLAALCQYCHFSYDRADNRRTFVTRRDDRRPLLQNTESA